MSESRQQNVFHTIFCIVYQSNQILLGSAMSCKCLNPLQKFLSLNKSAEKKRSNQSHPKYCTLDAIDKHFCCKLASVDRELRQISPNCLTFAVHRTSSVNALEVSFVRRTDDLIFLSMSQNVQNIVDDWSRGRRDSVGGREREVNFTHFDQRDCADHFRRWI